MSGTARKYVISVQELKEQHATQKVEHYEHGDDPHDAWDVEVVEMLWRQLKDQK